MNKEFEFLKSLLIKQYGQDLTDKICEGFMRKRITSFRINTLKATKEEVLSYLLDRNICVKEVSFSDIAYVLLNGDEQTLMELDLFKEGKIYLQSLSSMLPPIVLEPKENKDILDMAAAPGGKTTQIAALTNNKARITACELNKIRCERLEYNVKKQGATQVLVMNVDARKLDDFFTFDQILLDAPCSGSGTHTMHDREPFKGLSQILIDKCTKSQETLLKKALRALKKGESMVYSTCSILDVENCAIIKKCINSNYEIVPFDINDEKLVKLPTRIPNTLCVCPNEFYEGFYIAKIKRVR